MLRLMNRWRIVRCQSRGRRSMTAIEKVMEEVCGASSMIGGV